MLLSFIRPKILQRAFSIQNHAISNQNPCIPFHSDAEHQFVQSENQDRGQQSKCVAKNTVASVCN